MINASLQRFAPFALLLACLSAAPTAAREWSDSTGTFRIEAKLVTVKEGKAYLEKGDGTVVPVPLAKLSKADIEHLQSLPELKEHFAKSDPDAANPFSGGDSPGNIRFAEIKSADSAAGGEVRRFSDLGWGVTSLAFSPDGRFLAVGKTDRALVVFDVGTSQRVSFHDKLEGLGGVTALAFTPDGKTLLSGGDRGRIMVWSVAESGALTEAGRFVGHSEGVLSISISKNGEHVLSGGQEKKVRYWSLADCQEKFSIDGFKGDVKATFLTSSGKQGLACDGETLALIDLAKQAAVQTMKLASHVAQTAAIAPDGSRVMVNDSYALRVWDIRSGREQPPLQEQEIQWYAAFSPSGKHVLSGGRGKVNVWDAKTQRKVFEFDTAGSSYVQCLASSPDGRHFAAIPGSAGQDLQVFRLPANLAP